MLLASTSIARFAIFAASFFLTCNIVFQAFNLVIAEETKAAETEDFEELGLHYGKYLKDVVAALDKDQKFTETIKNMNSEDIKSGKVADQLKHVHEDVRKKLNDLKYLEIKRLRDLATRKNEVEQYGETYHGTDKRKWRTLGASLSQLPEHLGSHNSYFDIKDLHKLMVAATTDLEKLDKERREDFKTYEMEKEWQFQERLKMMNETEKAEAIKIRKNLKEKHDDHPKVHEPGTKSQFEEVWEKKDHLPVNEFDPKTFFSLHDTNSDNYWDPQEVRQLLVLEINKIYDPQNQEDDPNEMEEEYERMREHIYKEIDADKDGLIGLNEFLEYSRRPNFVNNKGWTDNSKQEAYSKQEYENYEKNRKQVLEASHGHYSPSMYDKQPENFHLPNWGYGMPAGVNPASYYGYQVDPNHPHVQQQMLAVQQQQQHAAYAYHQQAAAAAAGYPQANQQYHPQVGQQQAQLAQQPPYQAVPQLQNTQYNPQQAAPQQMAYAGQQAHPQVQQNVPQVQPPQQQQVIPQQQQQQQQQQPPPPVQTNYQQIPQQQQQQQAIPQQAVPQQAIPQQAMPQSVPQQQQQNPPR